jgi:hypothetical protein
VVDERVLAASEGCREVLRALSVAGDEVATGVLDAVCETSEGSLLDLVDEATRAGLAERRHGVVSFRHALLRAAVYDSLSSAERARLHDRVGRVLLARRERGLAVDAAALAHHFGRAAPLGNAGRAFEFALEAAADAMRMLSFDLAVRRYEQALAMVALDPGLGDRLRLLLDLADARAATGDLETARDMFRQVGEEAVRNGDAHALGRAALGFSGDVSGIEVLLGDAEVCALLERAADALSGDDVLGPRVLARLSVAQTYRAPVAARAEWASQARERAESGGEPSTVAEVLAAWCDVMAGPAHVTERGDAAREIVRLCAINVDLRGEALGRRLLVEALLESGDLQAAAREVAAFEWVAQRLGRAEYLWYPPLWRGALAFARAEPEAWLAARRELDSLVTAAGGTNSGLLAKVQLVSMAEDLADPEPVQAFIGEILAGGEVMDDAQTLIAATLVRALEGDLAAAEAVLDRCVDSALTAELDSEWPPMMLQIAELLALLGGHRRVAELRRAVEPYGSVWVIEGIGAGIRGPLDRALGLLAALDDDPVAAEDHFTAARHAAVRANADLVAALADHDAGRFLHDPERSSRADRLWRRIGATHRLAQLDASGAAPPAQRTSRPTRSTSCFACEGDVWTITFDGRTCTLTERKGLRDLARLLAQPGREIAALDLAAPGPTLVETDTGDMLDAQARDAYRARLAEIETELDEADRNGDIGRSARLAAERDALVEQLTGAYGLGGRGRRAGGSGERARTAVRSRIRAALDRIGEAHPPLGRHLERSIRTGTFCVYDPDPPVAWVVEDGSHTV